MTINVQQVSGRSVDVKKYTSNPLPVVFNTFAELQANTSSLTEGQIVYVKDDGGQPNWFGYDGTNLNWIISQQV